MTNSYHIRFLSGKRKGERWSLENDRLTFGRSRSNDVVIDDPLVSREHALLLVENGQPILKDLSSKFGTFLNDKKVKDSVALESGDVFRLGAHLLAWACHDQVKQEGIGSEYENKTSSIFDWESEERLDASETKCMPFEEEDFIEEPDDTREDNLEKTRMLRPRELKGIKPGRLKTGNRSFLVWKTFAAVFVLLIAVMVMGNRYLAQDPSPAEDSGSPQIRYTDVEHGFSLSYPSTWLRLPGSYNSIISLQKFDYQADKVVSHVEVYLDRDINYKLVGLSAGFKGYQHNLAKRHKKFKLLADFPERVNNLKTIFYAFSSESSKGKGIYLHEGDRQIVVECSSSRTGWAFDAPLFTKVLRSFALDIPHQHVIDYPNPDEYTLHLARLNPGRVIQIAGEKLSAAKELMRKRDVRPSNLFHSIEAYRSCLTYASALIVKPKYYNNAVDGLTKATVLLDAAIRNQKFLITQAKKAGDIRTARVEAMRLLHMIPEIKDQDYQYANSVVKKLSRM